MASEIYTAEELKRGVGLYHGRWGRIYEYARDEMIVCISGEVPRGNPVFVGGGMIRDDGRIEIRWC